MTTRLTVDTLMYVVNVDAVAPLPLTTMVAFEWLAPGATVCARHERLKVSLTLCMLAPHSSTKGTPEPLPM